MEKRVLLETEIPWLTLHKRGKVRDSYLLPPQPGTSRPTLLLIIATDRISAFDSVLPNGVPDKGLVLNLMSLFWFNRTREICPNHVYSDDQEYCVAHARKGEHRLNELKGRCTLAKLAKVIPVECVVRGYLSGSAWANYQEDGTICGIKLPAGLEESSKLPQPIFTPATKAESGHDLNIDFDTMVTVIDEWLEKEGLQQRFKAGQIAEEIRDKSLRIYSEAYQYAKVCGILIADTKMEFGIDEETVQIILIDELLTPDSSRFWDTLLYKPGGPQPSYDKQPVRDWLIKEAKWDRNPPAPLLPDKIVEETRERYVNAYEILVGKPWPPKF